MKISIIGSGYVGLVTGTCLAAKGHDVICVDVDINKVESINHGVPPFLEEGLEPLLRSVIDKKLRATTDFDHAVHDSEITFISAPTPFGGELIDLRFIREIVERIGKVLATKAAYHVVVVKSTVVPGTTDDVVCPMLEQASGKLAGRDFGVGVNPEFLSEGAAVEDFMKPDRIVIGGVDKRTTDVVAEVYRPFENVPVIRTANKAAEMIKYASNSLQATMISFANEIANLCSTLGGIDVVEVMQGVHLMKELSIVPNSNTGVVRAPITNFLLPGCGFGGSCFPKDLKALIAHGRQSGNPMKLLEAVIDINNHQPARMIDLLSKHFPSLRNLRVTVLGLAFKAGTDDLRESPAISIIDLLIRQGAQVRAHDPIAAAAARILFAGKQITICNTLEQVLQNTQAILLVTKWDDYRVVPQLVARMRPQPLVVDGRGMFDPSSFERYTGIGF